MLYSFVDCDMLMRFLGIGIGHCGQHVSVELNPDVEVSLSTRYYLSYISLVLQCNISTYVT